MVSHPHYRYTPDAYDTFGSDPDWDVVPGERIGPPLRRRGRLFRWGILLVLIAGGWWAIAGGHGTRLVSLAHDIGASLASMEIGTRSRPTAPGQTGLSPNPPPNMSALNQAAQ